MNKHIFIRQIAWVGIFLQLLLAGCTDEQMAGGGPQGKVVSLKLNLSVPVELLSATSKAMTPQDEKTIDWDHLQVLVFEKTDAGEIFRYKADITEKVGLNITVKVTASQNNEKYRLVVLANATQTGTAYEGDLKADVLKQFTFDCAGKWNAGGGTYSRLIPMWGECVNPFEITNNDMVSVLLHRALARVDVGLLFEPGSDNNPSEDVAGLDNFKIKSIRVYRTKNKAYTASDKIVGNIPATAPVIPLDAKYNLPNPSNDIGEADENPLVYELASAGNKYVREIYIPESFDVAGSATPTMDNVPCLVIGGYYGENNTTEETFYRADFATYADNKVAAYKSILRNHRYIFNIKSVSSPGFNEPEKALKSVNAKMKLDVQVWNEVPLNIYLQGNYFFALDTREVWLKAMPAGNEQIVSYNTSLTLQENRNIKWKWNSSGTKDSDLFEVVFDFQNKNIKFIAKGTNIGVVGNYADPLKDVLTVTIGDIELTISVNQKAMNLNYNMICEEITVKGKYREGIPLDNTHYIEVKITSAEDLYGEEIEIITETRKGIYFKFKDVMSSHGTSFKIRLQGYGTPVKDLNDPINPDTADGILTRIDQLEIRTNSISDQYCYTRIIFGYKTKKILAIGANAVYRYGYQLEPNTGSRAFVDASINFGIDPNSAVIIEQFPDDYPTANARGNAFHIEYMSNHKGMIGESIIFSDLQWYLTNFKPDIILTGQAIKFDSQSIQAIANFVNNDGVFLMFNEYYPSAASINSMVSAIVGTTVSGQNEVLGKNQFIFTLPSATTANEEDMILNGPFDDLRGKTWATDGCYLHGFSNLPSSDIVVYNTRPNHGDPCFFRYTKKPFVFIGDGGFISNDKCYIGPTYQGMHDYCPFAINSAYQPIARTNYLKGNTEIENSRLFGNILTWAVDFAEHYGINNK